MNLRGLSKDELGYLGESVWESIIVASGFGFIPLRLASQGRAPVAHAPGRRIVLPDFEVFGVSKSFYLDSKCKTSSVLWRNTGELRHGIDASSWAAYKEMGMSTRRDSGIAVLELYSGDTGEWSGALRVGMFPVIGEPVRGVSTQSHMVYWPVKCLSLVGKLTECDVTMAAKRIRLPSRDISARLRVAIAEAQPAIKPAARDIPQMSFQQRLF